MFSNPAHGRTDHSVKATAWPWASGWASSRRGLTGATGMAPSTRGHFHDTMEQTCKVLRCGKSSHFSDPFQLVIRRHQQLFHALQLHATDLHVRRAPHRFSEALFEPAARQSDLIQHIVHTNPR